MIIAVAALPIPPVTAARAAAFTAFRTFEEHFMRTGFCLGFLLAAVAFGQANFELQGPICTYTFPTPCGATGDPEGISKKATTAIANSIVTVDTVNAAGMPCVGLQYARAIATGPLAVPIGGPMPSVPILGSVFCIPVPPGSASVSFCWDFYLVDNPPQAMFNDGMSIDLIGSAGSTLANLAYADAFTPSSGAPSDVGSPCQSTGWDVLPALVPQYVMNAPVVAGATHIRVTVWNGGDDFAASHGVIDDVNFGTGPAQCVLSFTSPAGPGSIMMDNTACAVSVGLSYFSVVDLTAGTFPTGWFFGLDVSMGELLFLFNTGAPFTGVLDGSGASTTGPIGPVPSLSGLSLYGVTTEWTAGFGALVQTRPPVSYTIP
jgi:hypothetical protein